MIIRYFETNKINLDQNKLILFYGQNEGFKNDVINNLLSKNDEIFIYDEKEILDDSEIFLENIKSKSLFKTDKKIIIKRATNKILGIIEKLNINDLDGTVIIINAGILEKKSKLRVFFEKERDLVCVAFYPDNEQTLSKLTIDFFKKKKISTSNSNINFIVSKCKGDREALFNELNKIEFFLKKGKKLNNENLLKLINLSEDHSLAELIDNCLAKNTKKTMNILNENNLTSNDCILVTRIFLSKSKKIYNLCKEFKKNKDLNLTIETAKPKIFWKDQEITKKQIYEWTPENIKKLIYKINEIEHLIKKNINNSVNLLTDFIIEQTNSKTSN